MQLVLQDPNGELKALFDGWEQGESYEVTIQFTQDSAPGEEDQAATLEQVVASGEVEEAMEAEEVEAPAEEAYTESPVPKAVVAVVSAKPKK